jgi:cell division initiation protein
MSYAPVELRHVRLRRGTFGYKREAVHRLLEDVAVSYEDVWRERADFADRIEQLESDLTRYRELEQLLRETLVSAERAAQDVKDQAKNEARLIHEEARREARDITRRARAELESLSLGARRIRFLLHAALDAVDEADGDTEEEAGAGSSASEAA